MKNLPERLIERGSALMDYVTSAERIGDECYLRTQRSRAIAYLGDRWRGRVECRHQYIDSHGHQASVPREHIRKRPNVTAQQEKWWSRHG